MRDLLINFHFSNEWWTLLCPCIMIGIDFITGLVNAWASKTFQSSKMRAGLSKKVGELAILVIGEILSFAFGLPKYIMGGVALYIIIMELMSIFENLDKMGVPVPKIVKRVINNVSTTLTEGDYKDIAEQAVKLDQELQNAKQREAEAVESVAKDEDNK